MFNNEKTEAFFSYYIHKITYTVVYKQGSDKDVLYKYQTRIFIIQNTFAKRKTNSQENQANKYFFIVYLFTST